MKIKKGIFIFCFLLVFFSMSSVSANDLEDIASDIALDDISTSYADGMAIDSANNLDDVIASDKARIKDSAESENTNAKGDSSFNDLQKIIDNAPEGSEINLTNNYSLASGGSTIELTKSLTINGNGHSLDGNEESRILTVGNQNKNLVFKNLTFSMAYVDDRGAAILNIYSSNSLTFYDCRFEYNTIGHGYDIDYTRAGGAAVYSEGNLKFTNTVFYDNEADSGRGGAVFCLGTLFLNNTDFSDNEIQLGQGGGGKGSGLGGAVYCEKDCTVYNSVFHSNQAGLDYGQIGTYGGGIYCGGNVFLYNASFDQNIAHVESGGAIYAKGNLYGDSLYFYYNIAYSGCGIYCEGETHINNSQFKQNLHIENTTRNDRDWLDPYHVDPLIQVKPSSGGAIYSVGKCYIDSCTFEDNFVCELGAAIYAESDLKITGKNSFTHNCVFRSYYFDWSSLGWRGADKDGGAIYAEGNVVIDNAVFSSNTASVDGGAIYGEKKVTVSNSKFDKNNATGISARDPTGGAIQSNGLLTVDNCVFTDNMAEVDAGAIYAKAESVISNSIFKNNRAELGLAVVKDMGGAIRSKGTIKLDNCSFDSNRAGQYGGAIYADANIKVNHSSFTDNKAESIDGGAIYCKGDASIDYSNFIGNYAEIDGGALFSDGETTISNSRFNRNKADGAYYEKSYGGAVRSKGTVTVYNSSFDGNHANRHGGAIYGYEYVIIRGSSFSDNSADVDGGAVYADKGAKIYDSSFSDNEATGKTTLEASYGGAIRANVFIEVENSSFDDNWAPNLGGAIYCDGETEISDSSFSGNTVDVDGGAVYSEGKTSISGSTFEKNKATGNKDPRSFGGAVRSNGETTVTNSIFNDNYAYNNGGAVYANGKITIKGSTFKGNEANDDGGAVYAEGDAVISNSKFNKNKVLGKTARRSFGGGVCSYGKATLDGCSFDGNYADNRGGGIFAMKEIVISNSNFTGNTAKKYGGAVYTRTINHEISHSVFLNNKVNEEDGGAIYINNSCSPKFTSCRFENNNANEEGGAIFLDSQNAELTLRYCTFVDNKAGKSGQSIFNCGYYDTVTMCWFGKNYVTFKDELKIWHKARANEDYNPPNHLYLDIKMNDTELYVGNSYKLTGYLYVPSAIHPYYISEDLLHSSAKLSGDAIFSNAKLDLNNITADVLFTEEYPTITLTLDHQTVSLKFNVTFKHPSKVNILSCDDVKYPNSFKASYEIINMTSGAHYEILDSNGDTVRTGNITNPKSTISIDGLDLGDYSLWIFNPENFSTASSLDHKYFKVSGTVHTNLTADNVTYGNPTTITLRADHDGEYDVIINYTYDKNMTVKMNVVGGVSVKQVNLTAGQYQTFTSGGDFRTLISSEASFKVDPVINHVAVEVDDVVYGEESLIKVTADVDRSYAVYINGRIYIVIVNGGLGNISLRLDAGKYSANVSTPYIDRNYLDICKNTTFEVYKANISLSVVIRDQYYLRDVEGIIYASADGEYNLRFGNENGYKQTTVVVKDNVGHFNLGVLNSGEYEANVSLVDTKNYNPAWNKTSFEVFRLSTSFEIYIVPSTVTYGETATVMPIVSKGATGTVKYYLHNGTVLGELDVSKDFALPIMDAGNYIILANYSGDINYDRAKDSSSFTVNPALNKANVTADNVTYGKDSVIHISADVDGKYLLDVNGTKYNVTVENGLGNISLDLNAGVYYANLSFNNDNYNTIIHNAIFEVYKADVNLTIEASDVTYPQEFKGIIRSDLDGVYNFTVDNYSTTVLVQNGFAEFDLGLLDAGTYHVSANRSGNRNYNPASDTIFVTVNPALNHAVVTVDNVTYGEDSVIVVCADADGNYQVDVNGVIYNIAVENGVGNKSVKLDAGNYYANLSCNNINYNTSTQNASFRVYKADIDLVIVVFDEIYPEDVEGIVYASMDGEYNLTVNGDLTLISVKDNLAYFNKGTFDAGSYQASVSFIGNKNYNPAFNITRFTVYPYGTLFEIEVNPSLYSYGETANVTHKLSDGSTGTIKYYLHDGTFLAELDVSENLTLPILDAGSYVIIANYSGDGNYAPASDAFLFAVNPVLNSALVSVDNVTYGNESLIVLSADIDGTYQLDVNGTIYNITVENGLGNKSLKLNAGIYFANVTFENKNYKTTSHNAIFEVYKADVNLTIEASDITYPQELTGIIRSNLDGVYNFTVDYYSTTIHIEDGLGKFNLGALDAGTYNITANYSGDINHNPANYTMMVTISPGLNSAVLTVDNVTYGNDSEIVVVADVDGDYLLEVNGTRYSVPVRNGVGNIILRLDASIYYANLTFLTRNYNTTCQNASFEVYKADVDLIVFLFDVYYPEDVEGIVYASVDGDYNILFNNKASPIAINGNYALFNEGTLDAGTYELSVSFDGNKNYNPAFNKTSFTVYPFNSLFEIQINSSQFSYGDTAIVTHTLSDGATGNISYYLNDGTFLGTLDVSENLTLPILDARNYVIIANYSGDRNFISAEDSLPFAVIPALNNAIVDVDNVTYGNDSMIVISADVDGIYQLDVNGTIYNITVSDGLGNISLGLDAGLYYANLTFDNKNYDTVAQNTVFEVYKADIALLIEVSDIDYPQELKGIIHSNRDGIYNFTVDGHSTTIAVEDGIAEFDLGILDVGSYSISANYSGDSNYNPASDSKSATVNPGLNNVVVGVDNVTYGNDSVILVSADVDGVYQVDVNGTIFNVTVSDGLGKMALGLDAGAYYANLTFDNKNYYTIVHNAVFEVYKAPTDIFVAAFDITYPQEIEGIVYSDVDGEYNLTVGDYSTTIFVKDGRAEYNAGVFDAGNYTVIVTYSGDLNHYSNSSSREVVVEKFTPEITLNVSDVDYGEVAVIIIECDISGSVNVTVNGITETLDLNGQTKKRLFDSFLSISKSGNTATLRLYGLDSGSYPVTVTYNGDKNIESTSINGEFKVNALNVSMDIDANDIRVGDDETITVKLSEDVDGNLTITVDGKTYTAELNNGKASVTIPGLSAGNKTAKVYYSGDRNYNPSMGNVSFAVNKIKPNMTAESNDPINSGEKLHIVVKLPSDATGNVTIVIGGKNYSSEVKDGKAIFDISGLATGKYNLTAYYSGDDKYEAEQIALVIVVKDNGNEHNNHSDNNVSPEGLEINSAGNPIAVLLLALMTIGVTFIRRFEK